jgi:hypothetical protein
MSYRGSGSTIQQEVSRMKDKITHLVISQLRLRRVVLTGLAGFLLIALFTWVPAREAYAQASCMTRWSYEPYRSSGQLRFPARWLSGCQMSTTSLTATGQRYRNFGWENLGSTSTTKAGTFDTTLTYSRSCPAGTWTYRTVNSTSGFSAMYSTSARITC